MLSQVSGPSAYDPKSFQIFVKMLDGKTITLNATLEKTVEAVKNMIREKEGVPVEQQGLAFSGIALANHKTLNECKVKNESTLHLFLISKPIIDDTINCLFSDVKSFSDPKSPAKLSPKS